jgi:hypothetical protein
MTDLSEASREAVLRRLRDESDIRAVVAWYARGMDRGDHDLVRSCYHSDATDAHGDYNGDIDSFLAYAAEFVEAIESMTHHTCQSLIELESDRAWVETYNIVLVRRRTVDGGPPMDVRGLVRYVDLFARRDGVWRITHRKVVFEPHRLDAADPVVPLADEAFRASMGPDDPSYDRDPASFLPTPPTPERR